MSGIDSGAPYLIVGLGNPGQAHHRNRHNAGFMLVDRLLSELQDVEPLQLEGLSMIARAFVEGVPVILSKPQTFMNESGRAVSALLQTHQLSMERILICFDDLDLPLGDLRMRPAGGSSGHKGMKSIIRELGDQAFPRLRIGIGRPLGRMDPSDYVLTDFKPEEYELLDPALERGVACLLAWLRGGLDIAMSQCNTAEPI